MKITKKELKQLVKEAVEKNMTESSYHMLLSDDIDTLSLEAANNFVNKLGIELKEDREEVMYDIRNYLRKVAKEWMK